MGGYNTLVEAADLGVPTVCVPRVNPRVEQLMRARAFERLGLLRLCQPERLEQNLQPEIETVLQISPGLLRERAHEVLDFDGAKRAAASLLSLALSTVGLDRPISQRKRNGRDSIPEATIQKCLDKSINTDG